MKKLILLTGLIFINIININYASSAVISYGDGSHTLDTSTGFLWLDMTHTINRSYLDVTSNYESGGDFEGYRYATAQEVLTFWEQAGITGDGTLLSCGSPDCYAEEVSSQPVIDFVALLGGDTWTDSFGFDGVIGISSTLEPCNGCNYTAYRTPELRINQEGTSQAMIVEGLREDIANPSYASWLVSTTSVSPIPVPAAIWLFCSGLFGLIGIARLKSS